MSTTQDDNPQQLLPMRQRVIHLVVLDVLVLAELTAAMFIANRHEPHFTLVFAGVFFGLLGPTLLLSRLVMRRLVAAVTSPDSEPA